MNPVAANAYRSLPDALYSDDQPLPTSDPRLLVLNEELLRRYGLEDAWFRSAEGLSILSGNTADSTNPPLAMAYAGYQFGHRAPLLGDGRAHMLGQLQTTGGPVDVQLKGSGGTTFSRGGDGRATLSSVLREYLISEAMAGLGIATTRSLAVIETGDNVYRPRPEPGAILVRTAESHIRVGSFQHAADNVGAGATRALADFVLQHHFPDIGIGDTRYAELLGTVAARQAALIAQWMLVGFIHGVMNTDNMSVVGETIDFGPCAFMDEFKADKVFSSIDRGGRYAWSNQPGIGLWNLSRFAETLLPLLDDDSEKAVSIAEERLDDYMPAFKSAFYGGLLQKFGLSNVADDHHRFADRTLRVLEQHGIDMTVFFDTLTSVADGRSEQPLFELFDTIADGEQWLKEWQQRRSNGAMPATVMRGMNPAIIARNHRVEEALRDATVDGDLSLFRRLADALRTPYECVSENADLQTPPRADQRVTETFCGT